MSTRVVKRYGTKRRFEDGMPTRKTSKGIITLHPTKGERFVSFLRIAAERVMAGVLGNEVKRPAKKGRKVYFDEQQRRKAGRAILAMNRENPPTRQQKRYAQRKGIDLPA